MATAAVGVVEPGAPVVGRQLADDDCGIAGAVVDDFEQVMERGSVEWGHGPVVEGQYVDARQLSHSAAEAAIGAGDLQNFAESGNAQFERWEALPAVMPGECEGQPRGALDMHPDRRSVITVSVDPNCGIVLPREAGTAATFDGWSICHGVHQPQLELGHEISMRGELQQLSCRAAFHESGDRQSSRCGQFAQPTLP